MELTQKLSMAEASSSDIESLRQQFALKVTVGADILHNAVVNAQTMQKLEKKIMRCVKQANLVLTWRRSSGVLKMAGSTAKVVGNVMVLAAPFHPKLGLALKVGHKLWKFGAGLKVLNAVGTILKDLWQTGCRNALVEFTHSAAQLTRNLGAFSDVIRHLQGSVQSIDNNNAVQVPEEVMGIVSQFISSHQIGYVKHVINIAFGNRNYSPLFDFITMASDPASESNISQLMREIESFHFTDFAEQNDSKSLVAIGSFLHISRELLDFLDGLQRVTDQDCQFLQECLTRFTQESMTIMKVVAVLTNLDKIKQQSTESPSLPSNSESLYHQRTQPKNGIAQALKAITFPVTENTVRKNPSLAITNSPVRESLGSPILDSSDQCLTLATVHTQIPEGSGNEVILYHEPGTDHSDITEVIDHTMIDSEDEDDHPDGAPPECAESVLTNEESSRSSRGYFAIVENSKLLLSKTVSTFSIAVNTGTNLMSTAVSGVKTVGTRAFQRSSAPRENNQFETGETSLNRL